jgi:hypothetical protein
MDNEKTALHHSHTTLPFFPTERPEGMDMETFKQGRKAYNQLLKLHRKLGYSVENKGGTSYSIMRQARKFEKNGYAKSIRNEQEYKELFEHILDMARGSLNP